VCLVLGADRSGNEIEVLDHEPMLILIGLADNLLNVAPTENIREQLRFNWVYLGEVLGVLGTVIYVVSEDVKFIYLGQWSSTLIKVVGLGELFSNYYMTMSIDDHMIWRRSIHIVLW